MRSMKTPSLGKAAKVKRSQIAKIIGRALHAKRYLLTELEAKRVFSTYQIPRSKRFGRKRSEAVEVAKRMVMP